MATTTATITYWLSIAVLTGVLIWGLRLATSVLKTTDGTGKQFLARALSEKNATPPTAAGGTPAPAGSDAPSFSRVAGAIGAVGLAATYVAIGYWVVFELFSDGDLSRLSNLGVYFLSGSALFLPYAFNKLSSIFK